MSKIELIGPKGLLEDVLSLVQERGVCEIEKPVIGIFEPDVEGYIREKLIDEKTLQERILLEDMRSKIEEILGYIWFNKVRVSYIEPRSALPILASLIDKHRDVIRELHNKKTSLTKKLKEMEDTKLLLDSIEELIRKLKDTKDRLDFIGILIKEPERIKEIKDFLSIITDERFEMLTKKVREGDIVGLIVVDKSTSERVKKSLESKNMPELEFPSEIDKLPLYEKITYFKEKCDTILGELKKVDSEMEIFTKRWIPIYRTVKDWIDERLSLLKASAFALETRRCFYIIAWIPTEEIDGLRKAIEKAFSGKVFVKEREILEAERKRIPVILRNPPYFQPFEIFTKMLPLPKYTSFDPTPFIGIFFPIFFGMILGDAGYGLFLLLASILITKRYKNKKMLYDISRIMFISSIYTIFFGILFGEFFGDLPYLLLGIKPLCIERRKAVIPMIYFALAVGITHVLIGFFMGFMSAWKQRLKREAVYKLINILIVLCIMTVALSYISPIGWLTSRPLMITTIILIPLLIITGGLLAPLELLKTLGNIVSYVRIMAIGLSSVLLAFVANRLGGVTGDIIIGLIVAGLIHIVNILLGIFSPTIHSIRLHYVEFFSKFLESGGRRFEPLKK